MLTRFANTHDLAEMARITSAARDYLAEQGLDQWGGGWPTEEVLRADVDKTHALLAVSDADDAVLGVAAVIEEPDSDYDNVTSGSWLRKLSNRPSAEYGSEYLVVHRLAVAPEARRQGVASLILRTAIELARESGLVSVRVDTHPGNVAMQRALESLGFVRCCELLITSDYEPTKERLGYEFLLRG